MSDASAISNAAQQGTVLTAHCESTMEPYYRVSVTLDVAGVSEANCTCDYEYGGYCKHIVALLLTYIHKPKSFTARQAPEESLKELSGDELCALVLKLAVSEGRTEEQETLTEELTDLLYELDEEPPL